MVQEVAPGPASSNRLKAIRRGEGLTIAELQGYSGLGTKVIRDIEKGKSYHQPDLKQRIVDGLNGNPHRSQIWIFEDVSPDEPAPS